MEFVDGPSLADRIADGAMEPSEAVEIAAQLLEALAVAHQNGIVHRDIKPANILLTSNGTPKLGDFGLARQDDPAASQYTQAGAVLGTPDYMSPEQRRDARSADARSDQWSMAATLYEMLTGETPRVIRPDRLPESLRDVVMRALEDVPAKRFPDAVAFADGLRQAAVATRSQVASRTELKSGQCRNCQTINDSSSAFCESCGNGLKEECLQCGQPVGVWAEFCPKCGTDQAVAIETRITEATAERQEIESLRRAYRHRDALERLQPLLAMNRPELNETRKWAAATVEKCEQEIQQLEKQRETIVSEARRHFDANELQATIRLLDGLPEPLRTDDIRHLLKDATERRNELKELSAQIKAAVKSRAYAGLLPDVERFLELRPDDAQAGKLRDKLRSREQRQESAPEDHDFDPETTSSTRKPRRRKSAKRSLDWRALIQKPGTWIAAGCLLAGTITAVFVNGEPDSYAPVGPEPSSAVVASSSESATSNPSGSAIDLFNGEDLTGWIARRPDGCTVDPATDWTVRNGVIRSLGRGHNWLQSEATYEDFEFSFEWRFPVGTEPGQNGSGVVVRSIGLNSLNFDPRGIEVDLRANGTPDGRIGTGCLVTYDTLVVHKTVTTSASGNGHLPRSQAHTNKSFGEWSTCTIRCDGNDIRVTMDGRVVNEAYQQSVPVGCICLRNQQTQIEFRNIRLKDLTPSVGSAGAETAGQVKDAPEAEVDSRARNLKKLQQLLNGRVMYGDAADTFRILYSFGDEVEFNDFTFSGAQPTADGYLNLVKEKLATHKVKFRSMSLETTLHVTRRPDAQYFQTTTRINAQGNRMKFRQT